MGAHERVFGYWRAGNVVELFRMLVVAGTNSACWINIVNRISSKCSFDALVNAFADIHDSAHDKHDRELLLSAWLLHDSLTLL